MTNLLKTKVNVLCVLLFIMMNTMFTACSSDEVEYSPMKKTMATRSSSAGVIEVVVEFPNAEEIENHPGFKAQASFAWLNTILSLKDSTS